MGIYTRYATAFVITLLAANSHAAIRVTPKSPTPTSDIVKYGVSGQTSFPNGAASWVGPEYVDEHVAGNRFKAGDSPTPSSKPVKVKLKSGYKTTPAKIAKAVKAAMKVSPAGLAKQAATAGVIWAVNQLPGGKVEDGVLYTTPTAVGETSYRWGVLSGGSNCGFSTYCSSAKAQADAYVSWYNGANSSIGYSIRFNSVVVTDHTGVAYFDTKLGPSESWSVKGTSQNLAAIPFCNGVKGVCTASESAPANDAIFDQLETVMSTVDNNEWLREMLKAACADSIAPGRCYEELRERDQLFGPASQLGPKLTTTTTTTNPDGTTSTSTKTTQDKYNYTYSNNFYDVTTTTTTTTNTNGETTITDTTDAEPEGQEPQPEEEPEEEQEYTFDESELPSVEPFYEQKYPDGLQGVWNSAKSDFDQSAFVSFLNSFVPSFSGTCPAFSMSFAIGNIANFGTHSFGNLCYALDFVKVCIMLGALFLCRSIVFGG